MRFTVGLGIAIVVGMYADVNDCNVCSVCMFLISDFGFTVLYSRGCENGFARRRLAIVTVSFFFLVFYLFSSHKSWFCGLLCAI